MEISSETNNVLGIISIRRMNIDVRHRVRETFRMPSTSYLFFYVSSPTQNHLQELIIEILNYLYQNESSESDSESDSSISSEFDVEMQSPSQAVRFAGMGRPSDPARFAGMERPSDIVRYQRPWYRTFGIFLKRTAVRVMDRFRWVFQRVGRWTLQKLFG